MRNSQGSSAIRDLDARDEELRRRHCSGGGAQSLFILAAPRTGSTFLYQVLAHCFESVFFNNEVAEHYPAHPTFGVLSTAHNSVEPLFESRYGKVEGRWQPSEASSIMRHWFGGGHPTELVSCDFTEGRRPHFIESCRAISHATGRPLIIKNAWNCFRIQAIAEALPEAAFIWLRRDIASAAISDYESRLAQGSSDIWNSASPRDLEKIRKLPGWKQSVEQQISFSRVISHGLSELDRSRWYELSYEALCADVVGTLDAIHEKLSPVVSFRRCDSPPPLARRLQTTRVPGGAASVIAEYAAQRSAPWSSHDGFVDNE